MLNGGLQLITGALITADIDTEQEVKADHAVPASARRFTPLVTGQCVRKQTGLRTVSHINFRLDVAGTLSSRHSLPDLYRLF